ncbi:MAG: branched-chain amino acid ABC transporter permease [Clostridia bacterium]|nr:branched-chain amino acid ABC transporter permease [Clostridia bacterium]
MFDSFVGTMLGTLPSMTVTVLATLAITLIFKTSYTTNFAQGVISAVGAYVTMELMYYNNIPIYVGLLIGIVVGTAIGVFIDVAIFRNGRNVNAIGKQIITMGMVSIIVGIVPMVFRTANRESVQLIPMINRELRLVLFNDVAIQYNTLLYLGITIVIVAVVFLMLYFSKWGLGVRSTASNEYVAGMLGVNTRVITAVSWAIAGAVGAVAATMYAGFVQMNSSLFLTTVQVNAFLAGILGGFATFYGPVLAAVIISAISGIVGFVCILVPSLSTWKEVIVYVILLLFVLWKPQGLFGPKAIKKV